MSNKRSGADAIVQGAQNRAALDLCLEPMRMAARMHGYAIAVHGSLTRDIDLIAIPWIDAPDDRDVLLRSVCGAIAGALGTCRPVGAWTDKPHGRLARTLLAFVGGTSIDFDFGVMPTIAKVITE